MYIMVRCDFCKTLLKLRIFYLQDFDNILIKACELFKKKKNVLQHIKSVLVDEVRPRIFFFFFFLFYSQFIYFLLQYQDTNIVQYDLIKLITKNQNTDKTVTIVGGKLNYCALFNDCLMQFFEQILINQFLVLDQLNPGTLIKCMMIIQTLNQLIWNKITEVQQLFWMQQCMLLNKVKVKILNFINISQHIRTQIHHVLIKLCIQTILLGFPYLSYLLTMKMPKQNSQLKKLKRL